MSQAAPPATCNKACIVYHNNTPMSGMQLINRKHAPGLWQSSVLGWMEMLPWQ